MTERTNTEHSQASRKAAATRKANEAKEGGKDVKKAAGKAADAAKELGKDAAKTVSDAGKAAGRRAKS